MLKNHKKSWFHYILKGIIYFILLCTILLIITYLYAGQIIKKTISTVIPPITQTAVSIDDIDLSLFSGKIGLRGLAIGNPDGFSDKNIFQMGDIAVSFDPKSVLTDKIVIYSVTISGTSISAEINTNGQTNIGVLNQNIQKYMNSSTSEKKASAVVSTQKKKNEPSKTIIIQDLKINDSKVSLGIANQSMTLTLPNIHHTNIGENDQTKNIPEMIALILSYFSDESVKAVLNSGSTLFNKSLQKAQDLINVGQNSLKQQTDQVKGTLDKIKTIF